MKKLITLLTFLQSTQLMASADVAEAIGERLFNDIRFSAYYRWASKGNVNHNLKNGAPQVWRIKTLDGEAPSPFAGGATSCATCHMVDQGLDIEGVGMRGYNDAAKRTPIFFRSKDGMRTTLRNTPALIGLGSSLVQSPFVHYDGEIPSTKHTVLGNFTGRNMGWLPEEKKEALEQIVKVIRGDDGRGELAQEFGGSYQKILTGTDSDIDPEFQLEKNYRLDIKKATDQQIIEKIEEFVTIYVNNIDFEVDEDGHYIGSPYDKFLKKNGLPTGPEKDESLNAYLGRLVRGIYYLKDPKFVEATKLETHGGKVVQFKEREFRGLKKFFNVGKTGKANCIICHRPPQFTDSKFHNTGVSQMEYERVHGERSFLDFKIPTYLERGELNRNFLSIPKFENKEHADLGVWNFFDRPGKEDLSAFLQKEICGPLPFCGGDEVLEKLVGRMKTPGLRNLGHSAPYLHDGSSKTIFEAVDFYRQVSEKARRGEMRNFDRSMTHLQMSREDVLEITAFLEALNEEYE